MVYISNPGERGGRVKNLDFVDIVLALVLIICLLGLLFCNPSADLAAKLWMAFWADFTGFLGKKIPQKLSS